MDSTQMSSENKVTLNGKAVTKEKLTEEIQKAASKKGVKVLEVSPDVYKTRVQG